MNKKLYFLSLLCILLSYSCGSKKSSTVTTSKKSNKSVIRKTVSSSSNRKTVTSGKSNKSVIRKKASSSSNGKIESIIDYAKTFEGTRYKYGGTTKKGMDCSGLIYTSFKEEKVILPRTSRAMSTQGTKTSLKNLKVGDLLFFKTSKKNVISHVGLVVKTGKKIEFIHSSTSKGCLLYTSPSPRD